MTTIVCFGIAVMDLMFTVDELPTGGGKWYASDFGHVGGGVAANAAVAVVRLGGEARLVSRVGSDEIGERIRSELVALGVDVSAVERAPGATSPVSAVLVDSSGDRAIVNHTSDELFGSAGSAVDLSGVDGVLVDVRWPAGAEAVGRSAREAMVPVVFDFDRPMPNGGGPLLELSTHIAFSRAALTATAGTDEIPVGLRRVAERTDGWLAVTDGEAGVWWLDGREVRHMPAFDVAVVDTVGAGDVFHGAFALAVAEGRAEEDALRFASATGALKCTRRGGRAGTPTRAEVEAFLAEGQQ